MFLGVLDGFGMLLEAFCVDFMGLVVSPCRSCSLRLRFAAASLPVQRFPLFARKHGMNVVLAFVMCKVVRTVEIEGFNLQQSESC